jgi:hypothetical protein
MLKLKSFLTTSKFVMSIFAGILVGIFIVTVGLAGFTIFEQKFCTPKVYVAVESFLEQVKSGNYESFLIKDPKKAPIFLSREDFDNLKRDVSGKYSVTIKEWEAAVVFVQVKTGSMPTYEITAMPKDNSIVFCLGKDYKVIAVRQ